MVVTGAVAPAASTIRLAPANLTARAIPTRNRTGSFNFIGLIDYPRLRRDDSFIIKLITHAFGGVLNFLIKFTNLKKIGMSGHNKWSQIKHKKGAVDKKKSLTFGKILAAISVAAKTGGADPNQNPRLRSLIEKAKENSVPHENIERALKRAKESKELQEFLFEAYGPEGAAILVEAITDNPNRLIQELRMIAEEAGAKAADAGSVLWAFTKPDYETGWQAKFPQPISEAGQETLSGIVAAFEEHDDVQRVVTNSQ